MLEQSWEKLTFENAKMLAIFIIVNTSDSKKSDNPLPTKSRHFLNIRIVGQLDFQSKILENTTRSLFFS